MGGTHGAIRWLIAQPYLLVCITYLTWGANIVLGRFVAGHVPPVALSYWRWGGAFLLILPFAWPHLKRDWPAIRAQLPMMTLLSITGTSAYNTMAYWGLQYTHAINGLLIQSTAPLIVAAWTFVLFRQQLTRGQAFGILVSIAGVLVILTRGEFAALRDIDFNRGDVWFFLALIVFAFYSALVQKRPAMHPLSFLAFTMGWGALWLTPFYLWEIAAGAALTLDAETIAAIAYVIVFPSIVAYLCYNRAIEMIGPNQVAALYPLIVLFGSVFAIGALGERPQLFHAAGFALILSGVIVATRARRRVLRPPAPDRAA
ncbi:MAG: DMT family transporter [Pseudorhodoplanes sp.]